MNPLREFFMSALIMMTLSMIPNNQRSSSLCLKTAWGRGIRGLLFGVVVSCGVGGPDIAEACRLLDRPSGLEEVLWVHLDGHCSSAERREMAIPGADLLAALEQGKSVDLQGVVVSGDVMLDRLSLHSVGSVPGIPSSVQEELAQRRVEKVYVIPGSIRIVASQFEQVFATNLSDGALVILGEVDLRESLFVQSIDLSKTIFVQPAQFAGMRVDFEGFFIGAQFMHPVDFSRVMFGTHSRFHKAVFHDKAIFTEVRFTGVAEFLEVVFLREADFSNAAFGSGTGFSGSVFHGVAGFSGADFTHEIYFRFSDFKDLAKFNEADFHKVVDFSNARFAKPADFSGAGFSVRPEHAGSNLQLPEPSPNLWRNPAIQLATAVCLLLLVGLHYLRGGKKA